MTSSNAPDTGDGGLGSNPRRVEQEEPGEVWRKTMAALTTMSRTTMARTTGNAHEADRAPEPVTLDDATFARLVREHEHVAYSVAYRILGSKEAAEDATQEAFLRAYQARDRFQSGHFRAWLLRIVANAALDELRRRKRRPQRSLDAPPADLDARPFEAVDPGPTPEAEMLRSELRVTLERALRDLPEESRMVVILRDVHGLSYEEVAEAAGIPIGTVRSRLSRARGRLRDVLIAERAVELVGYRGGAVS